jgi:hypothetical protein
MDGTIQQPARAVEISRLGSVSSAPRGANPTGTGVMSVQPCFGQEALVDVYSHLGCSRVDNLPIRSGAFKADYCRRHERKYSMGENGIGSATLGVVQN